ncbi:unnamed protein product, partial [Phaeothamnion confervicola]
TSSLSPAFLNVTQVQTGASEVQAVVVSSERRFVREIQSLELVVGNSTTTGVTAAGHFSVTLSGAGDGYSVQVASDASAAAVEAALESLNGIRDVTVTKAARQNTTYYDSSTVWTVTFLDPVGDVPALTVNATTLTASSGGDGTCRVDVMEVLKGSSPLAGTFTLSYMGEFSSDVAFDASAGEFAAAVNAVTGLGGVSVTREDIGTGFRWWVTFSHTLGDLDNLVAYPRRWEVQSIATSGGDPTPLGGSLRLSLGGVTSQAVPFDATADGVKAALEAMFTTGRVDVTRTVYSEGRYSWSVTFRDLPGDVPLLSVDYSLLTGSAAAAAVKETVAGSAASLTGDVPALTVEEMSAGRPHYVGTYVPAATGPHQVVVSMLAAGGLTGQYFDNQWLLGPPTLERVDPMIRFDWGAGLITPYGRDYVSVRWTGKLLAPTTENVTFHLIADDGARLYVDHVLVVDAWDAAPAAAASVAAAFAAMTGAPEVRAVVALTAGYYHDVVVEYREETGAASVALLWSSYSLRPEAIPPDHLFSSQPIAGSPFDIEVAPGAAAYPYTDAYGAGLSAAVAGEPVAFLIQAKDGWGNNETSDITAEDGSNFIVEMSAGDLYLGPSSVGRPQYVGGGRYLVKYTATRAGNYTLHVRTAAGTDIYCGRGQADKCSPFAVVVAPGPTVGSKCEAEGATAPAMDGLTEAVAGVTGYLMVQAKDAFGNNRGVGGDDVAARIVPVSPSGSSISSGAGYRGAVIDLGNGTYRVVSTVPRAGSYEIALTVNGQQALLCSPPNATFTLTTRQYDGASVYSAPSWCALEPPEMEVVHGPLHVASCTAVDGGRGSGLTTAVVGAVQALTVEARDAFGNLRSGGNTSHSGSTGDGASDAFLLTLAGPSGYKELSSTAVQDVEIRNASAGGYLRLHVCGYATPDLPVDAPAAAVQAALALSRGGRIGATAAASADDSSFDLVGVSVSRTETSSDVTTWSVTFLSHLEEWTSDPLTVLAASDGATAASARTSVAKRAGGGLYPVEYTVWQAGNYTLSVTGADGATHVQGSSFEVDCTTTATEAATSAAWGDGLVGGTAGEQRTVLVQARDARRRAVHAVAMAAAVVPVVPEVQTVMFASSGLSAGTSVLFSFLGQTANVTMGTTNAAALQTKLEALVTIGAGNVAVSGGTAAGFASSDVVMVEFTGVYGDVPLLDVSPYSAAAVVEMAQGDAPFRKEIQAITCDATTTGTFAVAFRGGNVTVDASDTMATLESSFYSGLGIEVTISSADATATLCSDDLLYVTFDALWGDLPALGFSPITADGTVTVTEELSGIAPLWGTFTLSLGDETTTALYADASESEVEAALEALDAVGSVSVERTLVEVARGSNGVSIRANETSAFAVWAITFDGDCGNATAWADCPAAVGPVPLLTADPSGLTGAPSPYVYPAPPEVTVVEIAAGTFGNNQTDASGLNDVVTLKLLGVNIGVNGSTVGIGPAEMQEIRCEIADDASGSGSAYVEILFYGESVTVAANVTLSDLESALRGLPSADAINVTGAGAALCTPDAKPVNVAFPARSGTQAELLITDTNGVAAAVVSEVTKGWDGITYLGGGLYEITYTPTVAGQYAVAVTMNGVDVDADVSAGIKIVSAEADAARSYFSSDAIAFEAVTHAHWIQASDRFGNDLESAASGNFSAYLDGTPHPYSGKSANKSALYVEAVVAPAGFPVTDGLYTATFTAQVAGRYLLYTSYTTSGGLLATFFRNADFTSPVLASDAVVWESPYHEPEWCPNTASDGCDSTALGPAASAAVTGAAGATATASFAYEWSRGSPLDDAYGFPADYFSVRWEGHVRGPTNGMVMFHAMADDTIRITVNGTVVVDSIAAAAADAAAAGRGGGVDDSLWGAVTMQLGELAPIVIEYVEKTDDARLSLSWSYAGSGMANQTTAALFYTRQLRGSPMELKVFPGAVDPVTSTLTGDGAAACVAMETCSFTLTARDADGNLLFNDGATDWAVDIAGAGGWALIGRVDDLIDASLAAMAVTTAVEANDWMYVGNVTCTQGEASCATAADLTGAVQRGEMLVVNGEGLTVSRDSSLTFSDVSVPLAWAFGGVTGSYAAYVGGAETGTHVVTYTPLVRGDYRITARLPARAAVQRVATSVYRGEKLSGNFTLTFAGVETVELAYDADAAEVEDALAAAAASAANLAAGSVTAAIGNCSAPEDGCEWFITLASTLGDVPLMTADTSELEGAGAAVFVTAIAVGRPALDVTGSPAVAKVTPAAADAARTTAWGGGLYFSVTGDNATFYIQAKDAYGNNRLSSQPAEAFQVVVFAPDADPNATPAAAADAASAGGLYAVTYNATYASNHVVAILMRTAVEVQQVRLAFLQPRLATGSFRLGLGGAWTSELAHDSTADAVAEAVAALPGVSSASAELLTFTDGHAYSISFDGVIGDVPEMAVTAGKLSSGASATATTLVEGTAAHIKTDASPLIAEEQQVVRITTPDLWNSTLLSVEAFTLSFRNHRTSGLTINATATDVALALEALPTVGAVTVTRYASGGGEIGFEYSVRFVPEAGSTAEHFTNYGNLPALVVEVLADESYNVTAGVYHSGQTTPSGRNTADGASPFAAVVAPAAVAADRCTAVDQASTADDAGLARAVSGWPTRFSVEPRDRFDNRVTDSPLEEVQVLETGVGVADGSGRWSFDGYGSYGPLSGTFVVDYRGSATEVAAGASPLELKAALETLVGVGGITVTTAGVRNNVSALAGASANVVYGSPYVTVSADVRSVLEVGDWLRLCDADAGLVYAVAAIGAAGTELTLEAPYAGENEAGCAFFRQGDVGAAAYFQYVVRFDSAIGDITALTIDGTGLSVGDASNAAAVNASAAAAVTACDWYARQSIAASAEDVLGGYFNLMYGSQTTPQLAANASASTIQAALRSLDGLPAATVEAAVDGGLWTVTLNVGSGLAVPQLLRAEGFLLTGTNAAIGVYNDCPAAGAANCTGSAADTACSVTSVAGRVGPTFAMTLSGADDASVAGDFAHGGDGIFAAEYVAPRAGSYSMAVSKALGFGLAGSYFNNRWLMGEPAVERIDAVVDFAWAARDTLTPTGQDYVSVRWDGFVQPAFSQLYTFAMEANDGARLWVNGSLLFDHFEDDLGAGDDATLFGRYEVETAEPLVAGRLYSIRIEFRENYGSARARLLWSSRSQPLETVPTHRLYYELVAVRGSPFAVTVTPRKPSAPTAVALAVAAWDALRVSFGPPADDGGQVTSNFKVEWWSAVDAAYGTSAEQTLKVLAAVDGGTFRLWSPEGSLYPRALPWNVTATALAAALEALPDVRAVRVSYAPAAAAGGVNATRDYTVTFSAELGAVPAIYVDTAELTASAGATGGTLAVVCANGIAGSYGSFSCAANDSVAGTAVVAGSSMAVDMSELAGDVPYSFLIPGLDQASNITDGFAVRVSATNDAGYGPPSAILVLKPFAAAAAPGVVELLAPVDGAADALDLYWTDVAADNSAAITDFVVQWSTSAAFDAVTAAPIFEEIKPLPFFVTDRFDNGSTFYYHRIPALVPGVPVYVRVAGINAAGVGAFAAAQPTALAAGAAPSKLPYGSGVLLSVVPAGGAVSVLDSTRSLALAFASPSAANGWAIDHFLVEWWMADDDRRDEVQVIRAVDPAGATNATDLRGVWRLSLGGEPTGFLPAQATEAQLEAALEALEDVRDVQVVRQTLANGYDWAVIFRSDAPGLAGRGAGVLAVYHNGLYASGAGGGGDVDLTVGYDLTPYLPGYSGSALVNATAGDDSVTVSTLLDGGAPTAGLWMKIDGESYLIEKVSSDNTTLWLAQDFAGRSAGNYTAKFGSAVAGKLPVSLMTAEIPAPPVLALAAASGSAVNGAATTSAAAAPLDYALTGLNVGERYMARVSAHNARGYALPQASAPLALAPPTQVPDGPASVRLLTNTVSSLRVLWTAPPSDGGATISKYAIEWDESAAFDGVATTAGSAERTVSFTSDCSNSPCEYVISGLAKGRLYYVRVFAYNRHGFSAAPGLPEPAAETPCTQPAPPAWVAAAPLNKSALAVTFAASPDDGGCNITTYFVEWDTSGVEGYKAGGDPATSLLYSDVDVQIITAAAAAPDISGTFRLAYARHASPAIAVDATADDMAAALAAIPTTGTVRKVVREPLDGNGEYGFRWIVSLAAAGCRDDTTGVAGRCSDIMVAARDATYAADYSSQDGPPADDAEEAEMTLGGTSPFVASERWITGYLGFAQQLVSVGVADGALSGTFRLLHSGRATPPLPFNASAAEIELAVGAI